MSIEIRKMTSLARVDCLNYIWKRIVNGQFSTYEITHEIDDMLFDIDVT